MQTPYGEIPDDDAQTLAYRLQWYLKYGNLPTTARRGTDEAREDYGLQYERYIGHLLEEKGYRVEYAGIRRGVMDGGVDLVARAPRRIRLVQCKRWRTAVDVDVVSRLQGAVERFVWEERRGKSAICRTDIRGMLVTSGGVTEDAKALAEHLGLLLSTSVRFRPYPAIKGKAIIPGAGKLLMPFDKAYDRTVMRLSGGDRFFASPAEAFRQGFYYPPYHAEILQGIYALRKRP